jgi:DNA-binding NarL/FixJ family response regulator
LLKKRILLVDDNCVVRKMLRHCFEVHPDFEVSGEAENGRDAVEKAESLKPDLIVLDLTMPVMTGLDAAPLLRKALPNVRLILFTSHEGIDVERLARAAGIHAVVPKEQGTSKLVIEAQRLLASRKQHTA